MELKIDEEFRNVFPPLDDEEFELLEKDILTHGVISPIVVWHSFIIDGHNRYEIIKKHNIQEFPVLELGNTPTKEEAIIWMLQNQKGRRNLNDFQKIAIALRYKKAIAKLAKANQAKAGKEYGRGIASDQLNKSYSKPVCTREAIATLASTSPGAVARAQRILEQGSKEQIEKAKRGEPMTKIVEEIKAKQDTQKQTKVCRICKKELPLSSFPKDEKRKGGRRTECKECISEMGRKRRAQAIADEFHVEHKVIAFSKSDAIEEAKTKAKDFAFSFTMLTKKYAEIVTSNELLDVIRNTFQLELVKECNNA